MEDEQYVDHSSVIYGARFMCDSKDYGNDRRHARYSRSSCENVLSEIDLAVH